LSVKLYTCDDHSAVYAHLSAVSAPVPLVHLDAHCDLRGLFVDRALQRAWLRDPDLKVSASTWLSRSVAEGAVNELEWVHDEVGGRDNDINTVIFASDLARLPYRLVKPPTGEGAHLRYAETDLNGFKLTRSDAVLDIDWDLFADLRKSPERRDHEVRTLLDKRLLAEPKWIYVAFSPWYSQPDRAPYEAFVEALAEFYSCSVQTLDEPIAERTKLSRAVSRPVRNAMRRSMLAAKRLLSWTDGNDG
jgi:hypothetical protein